MSYPQPNADQYALNGYEYFRLNTLLSSPGDIYESPQGSKAFALGPESDIARVRIAYFDDQVLPTLTNFTVIDPWRTFTDLIAARNEVSYQPSGRPGRILLWPDDLYDPQYVPSAAVGFAPGDKVIQVVPQLDVLQYFAPQQSLISRRADKEYNSQSYELSGSVNWIVVPTYGRKYGFCQIANRDPLVAITFKVIGVNYGYGAAFHQETVIFSGALAVGAQITVNNFLGPGTIAGAGMYDAVVFTVQGDRMPLRIYLSDSPA